MKWTPPRPLSVIVGGAGVALAVALSLMAASAARHNNARLLAQQVNQVAAALTEQVPVIQSELHDVADVATATQGSAQAFQTFTQTHVLPQGSPFVSISLWQIDGAQPQLVAVNGGQPELIAADRVQAFFSRVKPSTQLYVANLLDAPDVRIGFAAMPRNSDQYAVYAELRLPADRRVNIGAVSPYRHLKFALYLGEKAEPAGLIEATAATPIGGHTASATVPFGETRVTLVGAATTSLVGGLSAALPWIVLGVGCALALASAGTIEYITRRRRYAEKLARDNENLYLQQRDIAGTLQHALLPNLPDIEGAELAARYAAGVAGIEVGGDWYDVIVMDPGRCVFVVGDVSGRGLQAATTMASLRHAIRAYVAQGDDVATVLAKLDAVLAFDDDRHFATVLAADIDVATRTVNLACAGHFLPLLVTSEGARFVEGPVEPPVGIGAKPTSVSFVAPERSTILAFTDGLVERRGEIIDVGLERLRAAAASSVGSLDDVLDHLMASLGADSADDDAVILGLRWRE